MQTNVSATEPRAFNPVHLYDRIVVPIDPDDEPHTAILAALDLKHRYHSRLILFSVANAGENDGFLGANGSSWSLADVCEAGHRRLRALMEEIAPRETEDVIYDVVGSIDVVPGVIAAARRHAATLVVLAVPADANRHVLRSRSERIAHDLDCAVLQVHPTDAAVLELEPDPFP